MECFKCKGGSGICVLRRLKEELAWAIDKQFWCINNVMLLKTVIPLRDKNEVIFKLKQYCMRCYVAVKESCVM